MGCLGVYVHIPFCRAKCAYCDFKSYPHLEPLYPDYLRAVRRELALNAAAWPFEGEHCMDTLFIGGGTPTVLPTPALVEFVVACREALGATPDAEITVEANPGTVTLEDLQLLRQAGVNRLSLGVQSLHDAELALLGRIHCAEEAVAAYHLAREAGFTNLNLDLILGLPGQTLTAWQETLRRAVALGPEHLSLYALIVEPETPLQERIARGVLPASDDDLAAEMYAWSEALLAEAGYTHYEISNWARSEGGEAEGRWPALACRHNLKYWRNEPYLGLGAAAYSYNGQERYANTPDPAEYIARIERGASPVVERETPDAAQTMGETMMLGLRLLDGVTWDEFRTRFGVELGQVYQAEIAALVEDGLLAADARGIRLTARGRLLGNRVFAAFLR